MRSIGSYLWAALAFGLVFSGLMLYAGACRLLGATKEQRPVEAMVWGGVGFALGLAGLAWVAWAVFRIVRTGTLEFP